MSAPGTAVSPSPDTLVLLDIDAGIATLTLNRPQARNALSREMMLTLQARLDAVAADPEVKVVVLAAAGPVFCAGHDLKELRAARGHDHHLATFRQCARLMTTIVKLRQPVIAKVHAMATAAGCQLVASCDLAVAAETASFATPGVNIGLFCSTPGVAVSRAVPAKLAMEMLLTGDAIDAATAAAAGLVNRVVPAAELDAAVAGLAARIAARSPRVLTLGKETFYRQREMDLEDAYAYTAEVMALNMGLHDAGEGIDAFLGKRPPSWQGR
ncbi:enoyl-CoA hydratase [Rhodospirillum centenum]|uniref:Enoyl-CoA hydratase domain-containing protein 3, mitochondrial n=1 Tax=Rhodospirillum centenum (strain ATCC 51521 / SW) TaxID=414684 RepID=B6IMQ6_RHOCS|nr:enoyl-CoA hydratase [Rhodospirillum centenum]ACI98722.1 enoyl-CoA hydratase [Rhodospirillum centenum SW]